MQKTIPIERMQFPELEALRRTLRLSRARVCRQANISESTYQRWLRYVHARDGGHCPQKNKLTAVRRVLERELQSRQIGD